MSAHPHIFPAPQADYLRARRSGRYRPGELSHRFPGRVSLKDSMPPVYRQALRGTCVASAVTALLEYHNDCRTRLSVQYLYAATKDIERTELERNLEALRTGAPLHPAFAACFHAELLQLRLLADANGGPDAPAVRPYRVRFEEGVRARFDAASGSLLASCFQAVETRGTCRYALWPYAAARATPLFGQVAAATAYPPGAHEDAAKHRVTTGLYLLPTPNNVDEIRGILAGANARRPMPVAVTVEFFEGCDGETYAFPETEERADGRLACVPAWRGRHGLLIVGYGDDPKAPGGGWFEVRNSLGDDWGRKGYGRLSYAYLECFAVEAGTILQEIVDYLGDGYDGQRTVYDLKGRVQAFRAARRRRRLWLRLVLNLLLGAALVAVTFWLAR